MLVVIKYESRKRNHTYGPNNGNAVFGPVYDVMGFSDINV
jgi:hypothetical protein